MFFRRFLIAVGIGFGALSPPAIWAADERPFSDLPRLTEEVSAVLAEHCFKCHGEKKKSGKLDLRSAESILKGGKRGPAIDPSDIGGSRLLELVRPGAKPHMPPGKKQLSDSEISILSEWVNSFASAPSQIHGQLASDERHRWPADQVEPESEVVDSVFPAGVAPTSVINLLIESEWAKSSTEPADRCSDEQFVRRVYLDTLGRIPTLEEADDFLAETESNKRSNLIDRLIATDEFAQHFARSFDTLLLGRNERKLSERMKHGWHGYLEAAFRTDRPWIDVAREILLARGESEERGHLWFLYEHEGKHEKIAEDIAKGFFGIDIACAQCHDHPLAGEIKQAHYWGLVAFFKRSKNENSKRGIAVGESAIGGFDSYSNALLGTTEDSQLTFFRAGVVGEARPEDPKKQKDDDALYVNIENEPRVPKFSRREKFVEDVLTDHPLVARNMVNRVWALLMGRGLVHPADEMDSQHPPSHPQLLKWLSEDFAANDYRVKRLVRSILNSRAYQLDSRRPAGDPEEATFAWSLEKPLTAEQLSRSLKLALDVDFDAASLDKELRKLFPEVLPENKLSNLKQSLLLSNLPDLQRVYKLAASELQGSDTESAIWQLFRRVYGRSPAADEWLRLVEYIEAREDRKVDAWAQVLWAMTTSAEFRFNH